MIVIAGLVSIPNLSIAQYPAIVPPQGEDFVDLHGSQCGRR